MRDLTRGQLIQNGYSPRDFSTGDYVRLYITYWGSCTNILVREGTVLDNEPESHQVRLAVTKSGSIRDRRPHLFKSKGRRTYLLGNVGLVEKLENSVWKRHLPKS